MPKKRSIKKPSAGRLYYTRYCTFSVARGHNCIRLFYHLHHLVDTFIQIGLEIKPDMIFLKVNGVTQGPHVGILMVARLEPTTFCSLAIATLCDVMYRHVKHDNSGTVYASE